MHTADFRDAYDPARLRQYDPERRPSDAAILNSPIWYALRKAATFEPYMVVFPEGGLPLGKRSSYEGRFYVPHGSYLVGASTYSTEPEGFSWNLLDNSAGYNIFPQPVPSTLTGGGTAEDVHSRVFLFERPRPILEPGLLSAQIVNRSGNDNEIELVLWFHAPEQSVDLAPEPNDYDRRLQTDTEHYAFIQRTGGAGAAGINAGSYAPAGTWPGGAGSIPPWVEMPPGGRPFRYDAVIQTPAAGTQDFALIAFRVPNGYIAAIKRHAHTYLGPGFSEGSGDLVWKMSIDGAHSPGYDYMTTTITPEQGGVEGAILAQAGQVVQYTISVAPGAVAGEKSLALLQGYFYPAA